MHKHVDLLFPPFLLPQLLHLPLPHLPRRPVGSVLRCSRDRLLHKLIQIKLYLITQPFVSADLIALHLRKPVRAGHEHVPRLFLALPPPLPLLIGFIKSFRGNAGGRFGGCLKRTCNNTGIQRRRLIETFAAWWSFLRRAQSWGAPALNFVLRQKKRVPMVTESLRSRGWWV